jgi:VirE N-terminal domain
MHDASQLKNSEISIYTDSFNSIPTGTATLVQILTAIGTGRYRHQVDRLRQVLATEGKRAYDRKKAYLPAVTFAGIFLPKRGNAYLQHHTGLVHADLDDLSDIAAIRRKICSDRCTVYCLTSPSGLGLKTGIHVPIVTDDTGYKHSWRAVKATYEVLYGGLWDESGKDVSRLCFLSSDPDLYVNFDAEIFEVPPAAPTETRLTPQRHSVTDTHTDTQDYAERAIRTAVEMIQSAPLGSRHFIRLRAARLLGGYISGDLLTDDQAYGALAQALVGHTEDLERALKTVEAGLSYGKAHPITLQALEADRQAWVAQRPPTEPLRAPDDPWDGIPTLPLRPYLGYRGITIRRVQPHG